MTEPAHPLDLLPEMALGVLPEDEAAAVGEHLEGCETCRAELAVMRDAVRLLPYAVEEAEPAADVRDSLLERISREPRPMQPRARRPAWQRFGAMAAGVALLLTAGGIAGALLTAEPEDAQLEAEYGLQRTLVQAVAKGTARRDTVEQGGANATLVYAPGTESAFAWLQGLPVLPDGKAYQAWFIEDGAAKASTVFGDAEGGVWLQSPGEVSDFAAFALTIEDKGGAAQPSQEPFVVMTLGTTASRPFTMDDWYALTGGRAPGR